MTAPALDPRRPAPARRRAAPRPEAAPARPQLRVLTPGAAVEADRRKLVRLLVVVAATVAALCLFGIVVFHVMLTQNQFRLDALQDQALERQAEFDRLRLQVAELESPDRIVADAQQLGMVPAPKVVYLTPTVEEPTGRTGGPESAAPSRGPSEAGVAGASWSVVKPHLADG